LEKSSNHPNNPLRGSMFLKSKEKIENLENISHELFTVKVYKKLNCPEDKIKFKGKKLLRQN